MNRSYKVSSPLAIVPSIENKVEGASHLKRVVAPLFGGVLLVAGIGVFDYLTGADLRIFPLYYLPIGIGSIVAAQAGGMAMAVLSTAAWFFANWFLPADWSTLVLTFNTITQAVSFSVVALIIASLKYRLALEKSLSRTDALTRLLNSRAFYELADTLVLLARRSGRPLTIAYLDLDNFKSVNDRLGHREGDRVIKEVADVLLHHTRRSDVVARMGGDEFVVLLPDKGPEPAEGVLERIMKMAADKMSSMQPSVSVSVGAISFLCPPVSVEAAVHAVDAVMYRAKQGGKNRLLLDIVDAGGDRGYS